MWQWMPGFPHAVCDLGSNSVSKYRRFLCFFPCNIHLQFDRTDPLSLGHPPYPYIHVVIGHNRTTRPVWWRHSSVFEYSSCKYTIYKLRYALSRYTVFIQCVCSELYIFFILLSTTRWKLVTSFAKWKQTSKIQMMKKSSLKIHFFLIYVKFKKNVCYEGAEIMKYICLIFIMFELQYMYC